MAFPTIPTVAGGRVLSTLATNPAGTHTSPNLSSLTKNAGDLLIAIVIIYDGNSTNAEFSSWGGGFTEFSDNAGTTTMGIGCAYKWSTGSETGTFTVASADTSANDSAFFLLSIPGAHASAPPEAGGFATGTSTAANAGSFSPSWGALDTLWIAVGGSGETSTTGSYTGIASAPANYGDYADSGISADVVGGVEGAVAFRQLNATSDDPANFSCDTSNARSAALLIAVRPSATVSVDAAVAALTLATQAADVNLNVSVLAGVDTLALVENAANIKFDVAVSAATDALVLATSAATVNAETNINAGVDALSLAAFAADVAVGGAINVDATAAALTLAAQTAAINAEINVLASVDALAITPFAASINAERNVLAGADAMLLALFAADVTIGAVAATPERPSLIQHTGRGHKMAIASDGNSKFPLVIKDFIRTYHAFVPLLMFTKWLN